MDRKEHVHIISAGETIHLAYPAVFRLLPTISHTYVLASDEVYTESKDPALAKERAATRNAVNGVKEISGSLAIPFERVTIFSPVYPAVRNALAGIHRNHPLARYSFDLSGGPKDLCMALFTVAPWVGAEVYSAFDGKAPQRVPVPNVSVTGIMANPNYATILSVLIRRRRLAGPGNEGLLIPRSYLFQQVWPLYLRSRARKAEPVQPDAPVARYRRGQKPANNLSQQTFSTFLTTLRKAGFIEEGQEGENRKEKAYRITELGETAFRFYADPSLGSSVKQELEGLDAGPDA
ncbi:MAG TPA: hypothetical protein PK022_08320 [Syntrophales bacterium]|nr:hypothetical protein [Syntrophales bacterium]